MRKQIIIAALLAATAFPAAAQENRSGEGRMHRNYETGGEPLPSSGDERRGQYHPQQRIQAPQAEVPHPQQQAAQRDFPAPQSQQPSYERQRGAGRGWRGIEGNRAIGQAPVLETQSQRQPSRTWQGDRATGDRDLRQGWSGSEHHWDNRAAQTNRSGTWQGRDTVIDRSGRTDDWRNRTPQYRGGDRDWRGGERAETWNRDWRRDQRYDWQRYRSYNRDDYRLPRYAVPYGYNYGYRRFGIGIYLNNSLFSQRYWIEDPYAYRLPEAYPPYHWIRYYNDALLVDERTGYVVDVIYDIFW